MIFLLFLIVIVLNLANIGNSEVKKPDYAADFNKVLCEQKFAFIIGTGRSGSTTLWGMLNQLPTVSLSAEHFGQMNALYDFYQDFVHTQRRAVYHDVRATESHKFKVTGVYTHQDISDLSFFTWIQKWYHLHTGEYCDPAKTDCANITKGFKEVKYNKITVLEFMAHAFPCGKFILNKRLNTQAQSTSAFWNGKKINVTAELLRRDAAFDDFSKLPIVKDRIFHMNLEDFADLNRWNKLAAFMGHPECKYTDVLHENYNGTYNMESTKRTVVKCTPPKKK